MISRKLNGPDIISVPLEIDDYMEIGYITHREVLPSRLGKLYIERLKVLARQEK